MHRPCRGQTQRRPDSAPGGPQNSGRSWRPTKRNG
nr:MAG TPA: hypothetical protein [Caudoviricetes sp.]